jgi:hypothetical protein
VYPGRHATKDVGRIYSNNPDFLVGQYATQQENKRPMLGGLRSTNVPLKSGNRRAHSLSWFGEYPPVVAVCLSFDGISFRFHRHQQMLIANWKLLPKLLLRHTKKVEDVCVAGPLD